MSGEIKDDRGVWIKTNPSPQKNHKNPTTLLSSLNWQYPWLTFISPLLELSYSSMLEQWDLVKSGEEIEALTALVLSQIRR